MTDAMGLSRLVEEKLNLQRRVTSSTRVTRFNSLPKGPQSAGVLGPTLSQRLALPAPSPIRRLSGAEAKERQEKGLCYYCDDRYIPGHKCTKPQLFMIGEVDDVEESNNHEDEANENPPNEVSVRFLSTQFPAPSFPKP